MNQDYEYVKQPYTEEYKKRKKEIGNRISEVRRANKYTQEQNAEILDVTPKHVSHTESGTSSFSLPTLIHFCDTMNTSIDYIVYGKSKDAASEGLPPQIISILHTGNKRTKRLLYKYLELFMEISENN